MLPTLPTSSSSLYLPGGQFGAGALVIYVLIDNEGAERDVHGGDFRMNGKQGMRSRSQGQELPSTTFWVA